MTEQEAKQFVQNVIQGLWPEWEPTDIQLGLWVIKLCAYDYGKSERVIKNWISEQEYQSKAPKIGKILKALAAHNAGIAIVKPEPIKVFELYDQDNPRRHQSFYVGSEKELRKRPAESYENEAEVKRVRFNNFYGGNWVIIQDWKRYFARAG